ncbi:c-type cytochrome [Parapedobacter koreensis]|uniref:c-type cytochrome n=1 Tax=Parapedobacter koreensis TaxID=332977 RepID=UPI0015A64079|nr:c-type cytochrome [Parapedobacter koreensis]
MARRTSVTERPLSIGKLLEEYFRYRSGSLFIPPSLQGSWIFPGFDGGGQWSGAAVDPETQVLYVGSSELPWRLQLIPNPALKEGDATTLSGQGALVYTKNCAVCHGADREGIGAAFPALRGLSDRLTIQEARLVIENGRNMMPAFKEMLTDADKTALLTYLLDLEDKEATPQQPGEKTIAVDRNAVPEYVLNGYQRFLDSDGYPCIKPPWGTLNAVDLNSGKLLWKVPLGNFEELGTKEDTGTEVYGGPVVTKSGLVVIAGTQDEKIRAFDKKTGKVLWEHKLPAAGFASPALYTIEGKQFIVIAAGGGKLGMRSSGKYLAFTLPNDN